MQQYIYCFVIFLKNLNLQNYKTENYSILVLKNSNYENLKDLNNKSIGSLEFNSDGIKKAKEKLEKQINVNFQIEKEINALKEIFLNNTVSAILIENSLLTILEESDSNFKNLYKIVYDFSLDIKTEDITKEVDITKDAFNIYISGIDTYGAVSSVSRSDVNMVISVNPKTNKILITSIPRDYYVSLHGKNGKDKLTHAGIYGVETSVKTLEDLLKTKINYYVKVNFSSVIKVVDALGGVDVYSNYNFTSMDGYNYNMGYNHVDGKKALSFVRERKAFAGGDRVRVENQAAMIKAMIAKTTSPAIVTKYSSLLNALSSLFVTNINTDALTEFIKMQVDEMPSWQIENYSLNGRDTMASTYTYGSQQLYVMEPNYDTVLNAQNKIKEVLVN